MLDKMSLNMCELCTCLQFHTLKNFIPVFSDSPFQLHHNTNVDNTNIMIFRFFVYLYQEYILNLNSMQIKISNGRSIPESPDS